MRTQCRSISVTPARRFARHQQQKNALDKASDSWEKTKTDISRSMPGQENRPLSDRAYDSAKSTYLDAKESARRSSATGGGGP